MASRLPPRVFVDTNVIISGLYSPTAAPAETLRLGLAGRAKIVISQLVADEAVATAADKLPSVLASLYQWLRRADIEFARDPTRETVESICPPVNYDDAPIVAAALAADVQYFITGDRRLIAELKSIQPRFTVLTPRELLDELNR